MADIDNFQKSIGFGDTVLRKLRIEDLEALCSLADNKKIADNLRDTFPHPYEEEAGRWYINHIQNDTINHHFAITYKDEFCGMIGLITKEDVYRKNLEIGYWLGEPYWGKGIGTQAVTLITDYGFKKLGCHRIYASVFGNNKASMITLEKNGFINEGILRQSIYKNGEFHDEYRYGKIVN